MTDQTIFTIGALGDSISVAFNAEREGNNEAHSWSTGTMDLTHGASHLRRLQRFFPALEVRAANYAVSGARAADLRGQVDQLLAHTPDYVTLLMGANDLARWLGGEYGGMLDQLVDDTSGAVMRLIAKNPRVLILMGAVPDQSQVIKLAMNKPFAGRSAAMQYLSQLGATQYVNTLISSYRERSERLNHALEQIARRHPGNIRFAGKLAAARFAGEHLSPIDSYHPSVAGQRLLADLTWTDGFFP